MQTIVHIMPLDNVTHNSLLIDSINGSDCFTGQDHRFIVKSQNLYEKVSHYPNVVYDRKIEKLQKLKAVFQSANLVIIHSMNMTVFQLMLIPRSELKKAIWVVWGHDLYFREGEKSFKGNLRRIFNSVRWKIKCLRIRHFNGIGIGFRYDAFRIIECFGSKMHIYNMPYCSLEYNALVRGYKPKENKSDVIKIMVGHSAYRFMNHIEILKRLSHYRNEKILISLVLAYGGREYAEQVIECAYSLFKKEQIEIISESMSYACYLDYINSVHIAVLDQKHQSALGNFYLLTYFGKKIFVNANGLLKKASILEGFQTYDSSLIGELSFEKFSEPCTEQCKVNMRRFAAYFYDDATCIQNWKMSLEEGLRNL